MEITKIPNEVKLQLILGDLISRRKAYLKNLIVQGELSDPNAILTSKSAGRAMKPIFKVLKNLY